MDTHTDWSHKLHAKSTSSLYPASASSYHHQSGWRLWRRLL